MIHLDATTWQAARRGLQRAVTLHLHDPNVTLIDLGYLAGPGAAPELVIRVHVRRKLHGKKFETFRSRHPERVISAEHIGFSVGLHWGGSKQPAVALAFSMPEMLRALNVEMPATAPRPSFPAGSLEQVDETPPANPPEPVEPQPLFSLKSRVRGFFYAVALSSIVALAASAKLRAEDQRLSQESDHCRRQIQYLSGVAQLDSLRRRDLEKILEIMASHNPEMRSDLRNEIASLIHEMSRKYANLSPELICATITHESARTWDPAIVSSVGALGLMQIMPATGRRLAEMEGMAWTSAPEMLKHPMINIRLGCRYLSMLVAAYSLEGGLAAYNGGEWRAEQWLRAGRAPGILREETANYVPAILRLYDQYRRAPTADSEEFRPMAQVSKRSRAVE